MEKRGVEYHFLEQRNRARVIGEISGLRISFPGGVTFYQRGDYLFFRQLFSFPSKINGRGKQGG